MYTNQLDKKLPNAVRLDTYKKALDSIIEEKEIFGAKDLGLCMLLPCILWNLNTYLSPAPNGMLWDYVRTAIAFPELKELLRENDSQIEMHVQGWEITPELRMKYLNKWIKSLEK